PRPDAGDRRGRPGRAERRPAPASAHHGPTPRQPPARRRGHHPHARVGARAGGAPVNVLLFAPLAWVALGLEIALPPVLDAGGGGVQPSFLIPLLVFVALHTEPRPALWAGLVLGLLV